MPTLQVHPRRTVLAAAMFVICAPAVASYEVVEDRIEKDGTPINLFGVNWFGAETLDQVPHGLWARNYHAMIDQMLEAGFNAVRVPICPATLDNVPTSSINYSANPSLQGLNSLEVLDSILTELDQQGIYILLDHHRPDCRAISQLWYTDSYSEADWIADLRFLAGRYRDLEHFVGIDLKNEPHGAATWGTGNLATDWNLAAERASTAVLEVNPDILVFVEGVGDNPLCSSSINHWWGGNLEPQACAPLRIPDNKLVFSPHVYGPDVYAQPYFSDPTFPANMPAIWDQHFGFLADQGRLLAPGEFGGRYGQGGDPADVDWQNALIDYFIDKDICDFFYWSWNPNSGDTGGILQDDWTSLRSDKLANLARLTSACGVESSPACNDGVDNDADGLIDLADPGCTSTMDRSEVDDSDGEGPGTEFVDLTVTTQNDWGTGYCADARVSNNTGATTDWEVSVEIDGQLRELWNGQYRPAGNRLLVSGLSWNRTLSPGATTEFGFCAERGTQPPEPEPTACSDGADNDGDGLIDLADPGCDNTDDNDEENDDHNPPTDGSLTTALLIQSDWGSGYCADVAVSNETADQVDWTVELSIDGTLDQVWNATARQDGTTLQLEGADWNNLIGPGETLRSIGFCAQRGR